MTRNSLAARALPPAVLVQIPATSKANAHIDPGSGSFFVQMSLVGLLYAGVAIKPYWRRTKAFLTGRRSTPEADDESSDS